MPLPTRSISVRSRPETQPIAQTLPTRKTQISQSKDGSRDGKDDQSDTASALGAASTAARQSRQLPRPKPSDTTSTARHTRTVSSTTTTTSKARSDDSKLSLRPKPVSSIASRPAGYVRQASATSTLKPSTSTTHPRTASTTSTSTITKSAAPPSRLRPPATQTKHSSDSGKPARSISSTLTKPTPTTTSTRTATDPLPTSTSTSTTSLRNELHQLHLVHHNSHKTLQAYKSSIATHLTTRESTLRQQESHLHKLESQTRAALSTHALSSWLTSIPPSNHPAHIQHLSSTIHDLDTLLTPTSTSASTDALSPLLTFDTWVHHALAIRSTRTSSSTPTAADGKLLSIAPLGQAWRDAMHALKETLAGIISALDEFAELAGHRDQHSESGLYVVIERHRVLARTVAEEVEVALGIERALARAEEEWEEEMVERVRGEVEIAKYADEGMRMGREDGVWNRL